MDCIFVKDTNCGPRILFQHNIDLEFSCMQVYERYYCPIVSNVDERTIRMSRTAISSERSAGPDRYTVILPFKKLLRKKTIPQRSSPTGPLPRARAAGHRAPPPAMTPVFGFIYKANARARCAHAQRKALRSCMQYGQNLPYKFKNLTW